jgi:hypothetical protein
LSGVIHICFSVFSTLFFLSLGWLFNYQLVSMVWEVFSNSCELHTYLIYAVRVLWNSLILVLQRNLQRLMLIHIQLLVHLIGWPLRYFNTYILISNFISFCSLWCSLSPARANRPNWNLLNQCYFGWSRLVLMGIYNGPYLIRINV